MNPLVRIIPSFLVRVFARPYVAGVSSHEAIEVAAKNVARNGVLSTLDLLAEDVRDVAQAEQNLKVYLDTIDAMAADRRFDDRSRPTISVKLSSYTTSPLDKGGDGAGCMEAALRLAEHTKKHGVDLTIDMESSHWTDLTLSILNALHALGHRHVGVVLQTRLYRTQSDIMKIPKGVRVRLVIGIYQEPQSIAVTHKKIMKERLLIYAEQLLLAGHYVELGTHDETVIMKLLDEVLPRVGALLSQVEIQMLYGVPRERLIAKLRHLNVNTRLYVPFAMGWPMAESYLRRRLDEYPRMMWLVVRNVLTSLRLLRLDNNQ